MGPGQGKRTFSFVVRGRKVVKARGKGGGGKDDLKGGAKERINQNS